MSALRLIYLALGAATASLNPFISVILSNHGMDPALIGVVNAVGAFGLVAAIAVWGHVGDRVLGRRTTLQLAAVVASVVAVSVGLPVPPVLLGVLVIAFTCSHGGIQALADAVTVNSLRHPDRQYGQIRLMASLSFALATIAVGFVVDRLGYPVASVFYVVFAAALVAASFGVPAQRPGDDLDVEVDVAVAAGPAGQPIAAAGKVDAPAPILAPEAPTRFGSTGLAFRTQPRLLPVLATVAVTWVAIIVSFTFLTLRIVALGGKPYDVGLSFGVSAFAEIPGMILAARLVSRLGLRGLFCLGAIAYGAAFASWAVLNSPEAIVATRLVTGVAYGGMTVAMVLTIGQLLPSSLQATGQALYQGTAMGLASAGGNILGGLIYGAAGAPVLFVCCAAICATGGLMGLATLPGKVTLRSGSGV